MLTREVYLRIVDRPVPDATRSLEADGYAVLHGAFDTGEVRALAAEVDAVYERYPADERSTTLDPAEADDFRYEMLNRSGAVRELVADRRILDVIETLLGEDCHVIANTAWRNPARVQSDHGGGNWHIDAGPHVPRPEGMPWDERIPYPVFAVGVHVFLRDCDLDDGPTAVVPGSHRSGQAPPSGRLTDPDLEYDGRRAVPLLARAGDVALFVSDVWHRRMPAGPTGRGRYFVQVHYGRRDIAQRLRPTRDVHHLSPEAVSWAVERSPRDRTVLGLHRRNFYDG